MGTPHKHAATIKAWADNPSLKIECRGPLQDDDDWVQIAGIPIWNEEMEYRVKPTRAYPETMLKGELQYCFEHEGPGNEEIWAAHVRVANLALRHAIDHDQVVPMAEVQEVARQLADKRVLAVAEAVRDKCAAVTTEMAEDARIRSIDLPAIIATVKD
jgi:hypothetical protein